MDTWSRASKIVPIVFGSILGANILTMSIMNFFELWTRSMPFVYLASFMLIALLMLQCRFEYPILTRKDHLFCVAFALTLFLPRSPYLIEGLLGYALIPIGDDLFHIPDLASITHTDQFPSRSTYDGSQYLGYYYAAWMPAAAIYHAGFVSTIKQALALLELAYLIFIVYFGVFASKILFSEQKLRVTFLIVCFLYGGFDFLYWASSLDFVPRHSEWWAGDFGFDLQFSNFFTLVLWTPQHLLAALSILLALYVLSRSEGVIAHALSGLLFLSGVFSSPFATLGTIPLVIWYLIKLGKLRCVPVAALVFVVVSLPLWWILLGNDHVGFRFLGALASDLWIQHKRAAFAGFLLVIFLELWPLIGAAGYFVKRNREWLWPYVLSMSYLLSTFFCWYHPNYSMRGSIVPIFTLAYLSTPVLYSVYDAVSYKWLRIVMATCLLGGVLEYASFAKTTIMSVNLSNVPFNVAALRSNSGSDKTVSNELTEEAAQYPYGWQVLEKNKPIRKSPITIDEARLLHPDNRYRLTFSKLAALFHDDPSP